MNKEGIRSITYAIILIVLISLVQAETDFSDSIENANEDLQEKTEDLQDTFEETKDKLTQEEIKDEYLKREWKAFFLDHKLFGPIIKVIDAVFTFLNPFFKLVLKIEYSFSWAFILAIILWISILIFIYRPSQAIVDNAPIGFIIALAVASLIGYSGSIKFAIDMLSSIVPNKWILTLALVITGLFAIVIIKAGGGIKKIIEKQKKEELEKREKEDKELSHLEAEAKRKEHGLK